SYLNRVATPSDLFRLYRRLGAMLAPTGLTVDDLVRKSAEYAGEAGSVLWIDLRPIAKAASPSKDAAAATGTTPPKARLELVQFPTPRSIDDEVPWGSRGRRPGCRISRLVEQEG